MSDTFTTPFMSLVLPTVGVRVGPTYASDNNTAFQAIDAHTHAPGSGVQVPTAGLNIDADLSFGSFNATALKSSRYSSQASPLVGVSDLHALYSVSGNLYWNNGSGTPVQITSGSGLNFASLGTIGGDYGQPAVPASVTYSNTTKVYTFLQDTGIAAKMYSADVSIAAPTLGAQAVTLKVTGSVTAYDITLPDTAPSIQSLVTMQTTGVLTNIALNTTNLEFAAGELRFKDAGIATAKLQDSSVTQIKLGAFNSALSASSGSGASSLSRTFTTIGTRPVHMMLIADGDATAAVGNQAGVQVQGVFTGDGVLKFTRDGTVIAQLRARTLEQGSYPPDNTDIYLPPTSFQHVDLTVAAATTYTYAATVSVNSGGNSISIIRCKLLVFQY